MGILTKTVITVFAVTGGVVWAGVASIGVALTRAWPKLERGETVSWGGIDLKFEAEAGSQVASQRKD